MAEERGIHPIRANTLATGKEAPKKRNGESRNHKETGWNGDALSSYLITVHFKFPDDLDGDFAGLASAVSGTVDVTEGAVAHFFDQNPPVQAGVPGHLRLAVSFFGNQFLDIGPGDFAVVRLGGFVGRLLSVSMLVVDGVQIVRVMALGLSLLLGVDGGDIGGRFGMRGDQTRLFAVADEIFQVLYRAHCDRRTLFLRDQRWQGEC